MMNEPSGGFMIARTFAEMLAALSDQEAGRVLKGLICEFWGCGEKPSLSDNPLANALYKSVEQTAREIDDNYQSQRTKKIEAGRKGAEQRKQKSTVLNSAEASFNSAEASFNSAEASSNSAEASSGSAEASSNSAEASSGSAQLNKSKVSKTKENKSKENEKKESKENKAAEPPSAVLTDGQRKILTDEYGKSAAEAYEQRFERWKASKKAFNGDAFSTVTKWLNEDMPKNKPEKPPNGNSSFNAEEVERLVADKYKRLADG